MSRDLETYSSDSEVNSFSASLSIDMEDLFNTFWNKMMREADLESWTVGDSSVTPPPSPLEESLAKEIRRAADLTHNNLGDIGGYTVRSVPVEKDPTFQNDDESKSDETDHDPDNAPADILDQLSEFDKIDDTTIANDSETSEESQGKESGQNSDDEMTESADTDHVSSGTKRKHSESSEPISTSRDQRNRAFADPLKKKKIEVEIVEFDD